MPAPSRTRHCALALPSRTIRKMTDAAQLRAALERIHLPNLLGQIEQFRKNVGWSQERARGESDAIPLNRGLVKGSGKTVRIEANGRLLTRLAPRPVRTSSAGRRSRGWTGR